MYFNLRFKKKIFEGERDKGEKRKSTPWCTNNKIKFSFKDLKQLNKWSLIFKPQVPTLLF